MTNFVDGILEHNDAGATYEGVVYDRNLTLQLWNGPRLAIFDSESISQKVPVGKNYTFLLEAMPLSDQVKPTLAIPTLVDGSEWQGTIINRSWRAPDNVFTWASPSLYRTLEGTPRHWSLIATPIGDVLMNPVLLHHIAEDVVHLQWHNLGLDLLAIV